MNYAALVERDFGVTPIRLSPVALLNEDSYSDLLVAARKVLLDKGDAPQAIADLPDGSKVAVGSAFCALLSGGAARVAGAVFGESLTEAAVTTTVRWRSSDDREVAQLQRTLRDSAVNDFNGVFDDYSVDQSDEDDEEMRYTRFAFKTRKDAEAFRRFAQTNLRKAVAKKMLTVSNVHGSDYDDREWQSKTRGDESLTEADPTLVSAPKSQRDKLLTGTGTSKITPRIYAWAVRKFGGEDDYTVTPIKTALMKQRIEITRPYGLDKSRTITVVPVGDYLKVTDDEGKPGNRREQTFGFAEALEEAAKLPRKPKLLKTVGSWEILHYPSDRSMYVRSKGGTEPEFEIEVNTPSSADDEMTYDLFAWDAKSKEWEPTSTRMLPANVYAVIGKLWVELNAPSESEEPTDEPTTTSLTEMEIGKKDRAVLLAFAAKRAADGHKLDTDGKQLDGLWMGGRNIATWVGDRVVFNDLGSKAAQTVQNALRKVLNPIDMKESLGESSRPRESDYTAIDNVTDEDAAHLAAIVRDAGYSGGGISNAMDQANDVIDGFGVESIRGDGPGGYWQDIVLLYVNLGDTYDTTLCYDTNKKRFFVGDWGGWVEEFGDRYKVESLDEAKIDTGNADVPEIGFSRGNYYLKTAKGLKNAPAAKGDRANRRTRFREMLRNEFNVSNADTLIQKLDALDEGSVRSPALVYQLYNATGGAVSTAAEWRVSGRGANNPGMGKATDANLKKAIELHNASLEPGGANDHLASMGDRVRAVGGIIRKNGPQGEILVRVGKLPSNVGESLEEADQSVAKEILRQLGGNMFAMMTGAKGFVSSDNSLTFKVGSNSKSVTAVSITLDPSDTYTVKFFTRGGKEKATVSDVYADNLRSVFTTHTGLETSLGRMRESMEDLPPEIQKAYRAWMKAANPSWSTTNRTSTPAEEKKRQERITQLKDKYELLLKAWKKGESLEERVSVSRLIAELVGDEGEVAVRGIKLMGPQKWFDKHAKMYLSNPLNYTQVAPDDYDAKPHVVTHGGKAYMMFVGDDFVSIYATRPGGGPGPKESLDEATTGWRTTDSGHHIYLNKGEITKGNPHLLRAAAQKIGNDDDELRSFFGGAAVSKAKGGKGGKGGKKGWLASLMSVFKRGGSKDESLVGGPLADFVSAASGDESLAESVPGLAKWLTFAGGTGAAAGKMSYQSNTMHGQYHIWPVSNTQGKHIGYHLKFANQPKEGGKYLGQGLWIDLGRHRAPAAAARAARQHDAEISGQTAEESLHEAAGADDDEIIKGMARALYTSWWADEQEQSGTKSWGAGTDIEHVAPATSKSAMAAAKKLAARFSSMNDGMSLTDLYKKAEDAGFFARRNSGSDYLRSPETTFGFMLAMRALGHGVGWDDNIPVSSKVTIKHPHTEYYESLEGSDEFVVEADDRKAAMPKPGDIGIESMGNDIRIWRFTTDTKLESIGRSNVMLRQRAIQWHSPELAPPGSKWIMPAEDFTKAKLYGGSRSKGQAEGVVKKYLGHLMSGDTQVHLFYAGRGPSGRMGGFGLGDGTAHFTLFADSSRLIEAKQAKTPTLVMVGKDGEEWRGSVDDFIKSNQDDAEMVAIARKMMSSWKPGKRVEKQVGGGAQPIYTLRMESIDDEVSWAQMIAEGDEAALDTMTDQQLVSYYNILVFPGLKIGGKSEKHLPIVKSLLAKRGIKVVDGKPLKHVKKESIDEALINVRVTANTGDTWVTQINGTMATAKDYFLGKTFNIGIAGRDKMVRVTKVEPLDKDAEPEVEEGWKRTRAIDPDEYPPIKGMEGPFMGKNGRVVYYDPKEGRYYDRKTDLYLDIDDSPFESIDEGVSQKHAKMMRGEIVVASDSDMAELETMPNWKNLASKPNPKQVGVKDRYIAWFKDKKTEESIDEGVYGANDPSPFDPPEVAKAKAAALDAEMQAKKRASAAARGPAEKLAATLTPNERKVLAITVGYIASARRERSKMSREDYDAVVKSLKAKGLLNSQGALSPSTRDMMRALDISTRRELFGESIDEQTEEIPATAAQANYDEAPKGVAETGRCQQCAYSRKTEDENEVYCSRFDFTAKSYGACDAWQDAKTWEEGLPPIKGVSMLSPATKRYIDRLAKIRVELQNVVPVLGRPMLPKILTLRDIYLSADGNRQDIGDLIDKVLKKGLKQPVNVWLGRDEYTMRVVEESLTEAAKLDTVMSMFLAVEKWVLKKTDALPLSAPVALQMTKMLFDLKDALRPHFTKTGREAVAIFVEAMNKVGFMASVPPMHTLGKKWNLTYDKYNDRYTMPPENA